MAYGTVTVKKNSGSNGDKKKKSTVTRKTIKLSPEKAAAFKKSKGIDIGKNKAGGLVGKGATRHLEATDPINKKKGSMTVKRKTVKLSDKEAAAFKKKRGL